MKILEAFWVEIFKIKYSRIVLYFIILRVRIIKIRAKPKNIVRTKILKLLLCVQKGAQQTLG